MRNLSLACAAVAAAMAVSCGQNVKKAFDGPAYLDESRPLEERVEDALSRMTTEEKVALTHAQSKFSSAGVPRLGIPEVWCTDGPHGIRAEVLWDEWDQAGWTSDSCTAFPALTALAASWDPSLAGLYGTVIGEEARYRKKDVLLGPGVNIYRTPLNGRNFEYMGEDPYLSSRMVVPYVQGVQSNDVAACVKHYALNNQETARFFTNVTVDDRTLYEIYLPAFKAAVDGGAWAIMGSYNLYKGQWNCHNQYLLNDILKGEWGFDGVVISDWGGVHDTDQAIRNGLDMEFGSWTNGLTMGKTNAYDSYFLATPYLERIRSGKVGTTELDDKARRILRLIFRTSMSPEHKTGKFTSPEHYAAARKIGAEGIVLLKNEGGILPLKGAKKILVVGENAIKMMTVGGGSSSLKAQHEVSPLDGLREALPGVEVVYERGYVGDAGGEYNGVTTGQDLSDKRSAAQLIADAVKAAQGADYVIYIGGLNKSDYQDAEGNDRQQYGLPYGQDAVIEALAAANPRLVVVNISGNAVAMPWASRVPAIVQDWYLGSEAGHSLADVLTGAVNPSGKLPFTFPVALEDGPVKTPEQFPGLPGDKKWESSFGSVPILEETYSEGIYVGYRWYEAKEVTPLFPFGYGLSYTTFAYGEPKVSKTVTTDGAVTVSVPVTNTGSVAGAEVVQFYVSDPESSVDRPVKELKGFDKVFLQPGETKTVSVQLTRESLSYFDAGKHAWVAEPGRFDVLVGASSADIRGTVSFELK
ncbi:MAG: glycoside hydrolase family 3 C-terminal domain-containing protein [Bacteroidales bacterium]|nr:glycoside hydrolase family 3 C-terminal domain-containing protein [Bacteroidales bacterium]MBR1570981.1 glycoside hydrolase family 3 C-terminal domain-containing protein [Bacteroidales bacterium]